MLVLLGPTATGKTTLAAHVAHAFGGEIISADSRQVYRGMDIGTGKDYDDYIVNGTPVPYHLIDIVEPGYEYNIFEYQHDFLAAYRDITERGKKPVLCGGSGMYLEAVLNRYRLAAAGPEDPGTDSLANKSDEELISLLKSFKTLHNITDLEDRPRILQALRIAMAESGPNPASLESFPVIKAVVIGVSYPRGLVRARITRRLQYRLEHGMIEEAEKLLGLGITPERLMKYGLEYRFLAQFLTGRISRAELFNGLNTAIHQFSKRQMTWFRRMERNGTLIHWIDGRLPMEEKILEVRKIVEKELKW